MKTLHVDTGREMAGGQWQALYLVERLRGAALLAPESSPLFNEARRRGLDVRALSIARAFQDARHADLIHAHDSRAHSIAMAARGLPMVVSRRVGFPMKKAVLSDWKYSAARLFLAVSEHTASKLRERGIEAERIRVIYDGVPIPAEPSSRTGGVVAIAKNGREAVIEATRGVPIHFASDLWQDLRTARVCVYWSEMEGLGSGALAAMAAGVPVIASRVGGLVEIIEDKRTGLLIDSPEDLTKALHSLLENPAMAEEMGRRARERASANFSVERMVQRTDQAYQEVLG